VYQDNIPLPHPDVWVDLTRRYVTEAVQALGTGLLKIESSWLDPRDPRDATIVYISPGTDSRRALVWDEVSGWRHGRFESGRPGVRTELSGIAYLGGGVLVSSAELAGRLLASASEPRREYRSVSDLHDGLDDVLRHGKG
jgi:hypothetical protein